MALTTGNYLIKISNTEIPEGYIDKDSYVADTKKKVSGTFTNAYGETFEEYYPREQLTVTFKTSYMTKSRWDTFLAYFTGNMISNTEDAVVTCWVPKKSAYVTQRCKVSGLAPKLHKLSSIHDGIYNPVTITLTGYARSE